MLKRFISLFICFAAAFTVTVSAFAQSGGIDAEAASSVPLYLRYYYDQMDENAQTIFLKMRKAILNCDKKVTFGKEADKVSVDELLKVFELIFRYDPLTFNIDFKDITDDPKNPNALVLKYHYKKETYDKMVEAYEKRVDKILGKLTDDMSTYKKIRTIHDSIINTAVYDLEAPNNDNLYGTLVKKTAKCDGYAKTFAYICGKAGIKTVGVLGYDYPTEDENVMHMWNKVYYNKQWYNVDVTWDDPVSDLKKNIIYDYFMIDDETMSRDHIEKSFSFTVPEANDDSKSYYKVNKKSVDDIESAKSMITNSVYSAANNNTAVVRFQCSSKSLFNKVNDYLSLDNIMDITEAVNKKTGKNIVTFVPIPYEGQYTFTIVVLYKNTSLDSYFINTDDLDDSERKLFEKFGIK